mgnify:CR=1 FL=1
MISGFYQMKYLLKNNRDGAASVYRTTVEVSQDERNIYFNFAAEQNFMMLRNMPHPKAIIRYLRMLTESNGIPLRVNLLLKESLYTKTVNPFMKKTVKMLKPFRLTVFAIKQLLHALANPVNENRKSKLQSVKNETMQSDCIIRLLCFFKKSAEKSA